jgi:putative DNA primase/helicase
MIETTRSNNLSVRIKPRAPYETAQIFCERRAGKANEAVIRYRNTWYLWNGSFYRKLDTENVRAGLWKFLANALVREKRLAQVEGEDGQTKEEWVDRPFRPEPGDVNKLYDALMARPEIRVADTISAPGWLSTGSGNHKPGDMLPCSNTLVDLITGEQLPHTPYFLTMNAVDYAYDPAAACPRFEQFLSEILPGSAAQRPEDYDTWDDERKDAQQRRELVQEIFGYLLSLDTSQQKLFLFMGKPRSGKGTLARVLRRLIGAANVIGFSLDSLDNDFGAEDLIDKQVAIVGDARLDGRTHKQVSRLLSYSGEDAVTINRKNEKKWHGTLSVRFLILTNPLLHFTDASGVIATRFVPVLFSESFLGRENDKLTEELLTELPGILNWGIAGLRRLRERGRFVLPPSSLDVLARIAKKAAPVLNFVEDECELGLDCSVKRDELFERYKTWCQESGHRAMSKSAFVTALEDADPSIKCRRPSAEDGSYQRPYVFFGIKLRGIGSPKVVPIGNRLAA